MNAPTTLAAFALGLAVVFAGAIGVGAAVGPVGPVSGEPAGDQDGPERSDTGEHSDTGQPSDTSEHSNTDPQQEHP